MTENVTNPSLMKNASLMAKTAVQMLLPLVMDIATMKIWSNYATMMEETAVIPRRLKMEYVTQII